MSMATVVFKDPATGKNRRSFRTVYDPSTAMFSSVDSAATYDRFHGNPEYYKVKPEEAEVRITFPKSEVLWCNTEARHYWKLTDVPCQCGGYGADLKAFSLTDELRAERAAGDPKPPRYVEWRDKFIADYEAQGPTKEQLQLAYPNVPSLK